MNKVILIYTKTHNDEILTIYNYIWKDGTIWKINAKNDKEKPFLLQPTQADTENIEQMGKIEIPYWYPQDEFPNTPSIKGKFIKDIGGNSFSYRVVINSSARTYVIKMIYCAAMRYI